MNSRGICRTNAVAFARFTSAAARDDRIARERVLTRAVKLGLWASNLAAVIATPALAQDVGPGEPESTQVIEEVTVTGSRIRRSDFIANSPIVTVTEQTFEETSTIGFETIMNQLPQFVPAVTQFNTANVQNAATETVGASVVSLRGLGPNRNLVLIDGRRGQPVNASLVVDTNSIPTSAIARVEVISGGASAVYGADAVGGVVNLILKDDFEGATFEARYGETMEGDNQELMLSGLIGANLADDRGNVMFGFEHARREEVLTIGRDWRVEDLNNPNVLGTHFWFSETFVTSLTGGPPALGNYPTQAAIDQIFPEAPPESVPRNSPWYINPTPDGTGTVFTGAGSFNGATSAAGGYKYDGPLYLDKYPGIAYRKIHPNGQVTENSLDGWSSIPLERHSLFGQGRYNLTDSVRVRAQGIFSRNSNETLFGGFASALNQNGAIIPHGDEIYEPSLMEDGVTTDPAYRPGGVYGLNCPPTGGCTESQAFPLPPELEFLLASRPDPNEDIRINRPLDFLGPRPTMTDTTTFQLTLGLEGEIFRDSTWEIYASTGTTETSVNYLGVAGRERWRGVVQSPNFGKGFVAQGNAEGAGFAGGIATCTTGLPIVREFEVSQDCIDAIQAKLQNNTELEQNIVEATLTGNLADMRAGPLGYALGATYRDERYEYRTDSYTTNESWTATGLGVFPTSNTTGEFDVSELYGELLIPLVADKPGARHLNLELGGRVSEYSTVGTVNTYKALIDWAITPWARVRGGVNRATRAPNIGELFLSRTQQFGGTGAQLGDQCSENNQDGPYSANPNANINGAEGAAFAKKICEAIMGPQGAAEYYGRPVEDQPTVGNTGIPNWIGNPNLDAEEADTFTLGIVLDSPFEGEILGGFTVTLDYYTIEITDMIAVEDGDAVFQRCLDPRFNPDGDPNVPACRAMLRDPFTGNPASMDLSYTNLGRAVTSGIDVQLNWSTRFANGGGLNLTLLGNRNLENITQAEPTIEEIDWAGTLGCALGLQCMGYDYRIFTTANYFRGPFSVSLRWQHWPSIKAAAAATNPDTDAIGVRSSYDLFALTGSYRIGDRYTLRFGIENLFDRKPPKSGGDPDNDAFPIDSTRAGGGATYDPLGRRMFFSATMEF